MLIETFDHPNSQKNIKNKFPCFLIEGFDKRIQLKMSTFNTLKVHFPKELFAWLYFLSYSNVSC